MHNSNTQKLPQGFVYLKDIAPSIIEDIRYCTKENFIGKQIRSYIQPRAILTLKAAQALALVQEHVLKDGYSLVIYDAYRPQAAVDSFVEWGEDLIARDMQRNYYPRIEKKDIFTLEYIAPRSSHSRGSTVDVTIIDKHVKPKKLPEINCCERTLSDNSKIIYLDDNTKDMGTSFDLFDIASHHDSNLVSEDASHNRNYLRARMQQYGFLSYYAEWWHYTLKDEPFPDTYFNFDVC